MKRNPMKADSVCACMCVGVCVCVCVDGRGIGLDLSTSIEKSAGADLCRRGNAVERIWIRPFQHRRWPTHFRALDWADRVKRQICAQVQRTKSPPFAVVCSELLIGFRTSSSCLLCKALCYSIFAWYCESHNDLPLLYLPQYDVIMGGSKLINYFEWAPKSNIMTRISNWNHFFSLFHLTYGNHSCLIRSWYSKISGDMLESIGSNRKKISISII